MEEEEQRRESPSPDDDVKPDRPTDLTGRTWKFVVRKTFREFSDDQCTDLAAALTYYSVLALFPAILALVSVLGLIGQGQQGTGALMDVVRELAPDAADTVGSVADQLAHSSASGITLVIGLAGALWSASGYIGAFGRAMNRIYEVSEGRPFWKLRATLLLVTVIAVVMVAAVAIGLVVSGPVAETVGSVVGLGETAVTVWNIAKWPLMLLAVILIVAILYYATPNVKQPKFRWVSVGAGVAVGIWILASVGFGFYVANFANYDKTYGSLAGIIIFLLWLWMTNLALLFGAELDAEMERGRQLQAGLPAEKEIQLPARDTTVIDKTHTKNREELSEARGIRRTKGKQS